MVVRIGQATSRGQAGQTAVTGRGSYNFSNLYNLNRADNQTANEVGKIGGQMRQAQTDVDRFGREGSAAARAGNSQGVTDANTGIANAINSARSGASQASAYNPAVNAMKAGASAYQAGVADFYAGGTQAKQSARKFAGLYNSINATGQRTMRDLPGQLAQGQADANQRYANEQAAEKKAADQRHAIDYANYDRNLEGGPNREVRTMDNLSWMQKTGRISAEQMYRAQNDKQYYDYLMKKFS